MTMMCQTISVRMLGERLSIVLGARAAARCTASFDSKRCFLANCRDARERVAVEEVGTCGGRWHDPGRAYSKLAVPAEINDGMQITIFSMQVSTSFVSDARKSMP
jgi:hypothetical protein